ncbi:hypothetical protein DFH29DRAFT_805802, partial [Suillus ampliporus]
AIKALKYYAIAVSPEQIMKPNGDFEKLLKDPLFSRYLVSIVIDEAHCVTEWGEFRPEYQELGHLRYILPSNALIMITSATLTKASLTSTTRLLHMHADKMITIRQSSDHPNIKIGVRKIKYALNSYADLSVGILQCISLTRRMFDESIEDFITIDKKVFNKMMSIILLVLQN